MCKDESDNGVMELGGIGMTRAPAQVGGFAADIGFAEFFEIATGHPPYAWQRRAASVIPDAITVPTGCGKSEGVVLPWLWRLATGQDGTPRRLALVLPRRVLCTDLEARAHVILERLGLGDYIDIHVLMGGGRFDRTAHQNWRMNPHRPSLVIGTIDAILSTLLHRGYFATRSAATMDFALLGNDTHIVLDEGHLSDQAVATLRQLNAFQLEDGSFGTIGLTVMSATLDIERLDTVDNPVDSNITIGLEEGDRFSSLRARLEAARIVREVAASKPVEVAMHVLDRHQPGTLSLVICNTVDDARATYKAVARAKPEDDLLLVHSRFRASERAEQQERLERLRCDGGIVVSTSSLEAGVDLDARVLVTEASPIASFSQRVGRCNRAGLLSAHEAEVWWLAPLTPSKSPYDPNEVNALVGKLREHEGETITADVLAGLRASLPTPDLVRRVLRRRDFAQLFDTTPDLAGDDVDIRPFISVDDDIDLAVAWVADDELSRDALAARPRKPPVMAALCPVPLSAARRLIARPGVRAAAFRNEYDQWRLVSKQADLRPRDVLLVAASSGGYDKVTGFDPISKGFVEPLAPVDLTPDADGTEAEAGAASEQDKWVTLEQHLIDTENQAVHLLDALGFVNDPDLESSVRVAALAHDLGKAHPVWQQILPLDEQPTPDGGPWAKAPRDSQAAPMGVGVRRGLRHEVITALALLTDDGRRALVSHGVSPKWHPLVAYLAAAHHGKLRAAVWDPRRDGHSGDAIYGLTPADSSPALRVAGFDLPEKPLELDILQTSGGEGWASMVDNLIDEFGPFRLAMLETLVRVADWRASAGLDPCEEC